MDNTTNFNKVKDSIVKAYKAYDNYKIGNIITKALYKDKIINHTESIILTNFWIDLKTYGLK